MSEIKFPAYATPATRSTDTYNAEYRRPALREFGVSVEPYYRDRRNEPSLEWFTGHNTPPTAQHLAATMLLLEYLKAANYSDKPSSVRKRADYIARFTSSLDSPNETHVAFTDIFTMTSRKQDKLTVTVQPAVFNYTDNRFRHEQGSEPTPVHIPEHYTELVGYLELIRTSLTQKTREEEMRLAPVDSSCEPTTEELELQNVNNNSGLLSRLKLTFWR